VDEMGDEDRWCRSSTDDLEDAVDRAFHFISLYITATTARNDALFGGSDVSNRAV
jgi:hypothetical protein